eukprot:PITA_25969
MIEEAKRPLNECHSGACGGHMSGYATAQKIHRDSYLWPSIFKDCILVVHKCHECQIYQRKMRAPPTHLHPIITIGPFAKWGIDYMTCNPSSVGGNGYIIVAVDYFTKWTEAMHTYSAELAYGLEATLPIECEIPSLKLAVELLPETSPQEECLLYLERLDETRHLDALVIEAQKKWVKSHFDQSVSPRAFSEGDLVLLYDQANDKLGTGTFEPMWHGPYIVKHVLQKGAYELIDYEGNPLDKPRNKLYLKKYYA